MMLDGIKLPLVVSSSVRSVFLITFNHTYIQAVVYSLSMQLPLKSRHIGYIAAIMTFIAILSMAILAVLPLICSRRVA